MSQENEQRLRCDAMASLSAAVNIITTDGPAGVAASPPRRCVR